jgi:hypothetical protein
VAATRALAGRDRHFDQVSVAIDQEMGPAEMRYQPKGAAGPLGEHAFGFLVCFLFCTKSKEAFSTP